MEFRLNRTSTSYEVTESLGSSSIYELTAMTPAEASGLPSLNGGTYYKGNNDVYGIIQKDDSVIVVKPFDENPMTNQMSATYLCSKAE